MICSVCITKLVVQENEQFAKLPVNKINIVFYVCGITLHSSQLYSTFVYFKHQHKAAEQHMMKASKFISHYVQS